MNTSCLRMQKIGSIWKSGSWTWNKRPAASPTSKKHRIYATCCVPFSFTFGIRWCHHVIWPNYCWNKPSNKMRIFSWNAFRLAWPIMRGKLSALRKFNAAQMAHFSLRHGSTHPIRIASTLMCRFLRKSKIIRSSAGASSHCVVWPSKRTQTKMVGMAFCLMQFISFVDNFFTTVPFVVRFRCRPAAMGYRLLSTGHSLWQSTNHKRLQFARVAWDTWGVAADCPLKRYLQIEYGNRSTVHGTSNCVENVNFIWIFSQIPFFSFLQIGVLITGVQNDIKHVRTVHVCTSYFSKANPTLNIDNLLPYGELELSAITLSPHLIGKDRNLLNLQVIIVPMGVYTCYDTIPFEFK